MKMKRTKVLHRPSYLFMEQDHFCLDKKYILDIHAKGIIIIISIYKKYPIKYRLTIYTHANSGIYIRIYVYIYNIFLNIYVIYIYISVTQTLHAVIVIDG